MTSINNCNANVTVVQSLPDTPAISAEALKIAFDGSAANIVLWLNTTFIPELEAIFDGKQNKLSNLSNDKVIVSSNDSIAESTITADELNALSGISANIQNQLNTLQGKITYGSSAPSGGNNGDIYIQYS